MLVPWFETPLFAELEAFRREVDALVSAPQTFDVPRGLTAGRGLHFREEGDHYIVKADLPGLAADKLDVQVAGRQLTISGQRELTVPEGFTLQHRERSEWRFERTLSLPDDVDPDGVEATLTDGVLSVHLPRVAEIAPRQITVQA